MVNAMNKGDVFGFLGPQPVAVGTGLICLDLIYEGDLRSAPLAWAGGSCGNVLAILSYLGWRCYPIARLVSDFAGQYILCDLQRWGVSLEFAQLQPRKSTPIFVQRIRRDGYGIPSHTFSSRCPACGERLPGYQPVPLVAARTAAASIGAASIFYLDRLSPGALALARHYSEKGALVVYEPSGIGEPALFREALSLSHIIKYSEDRLGELPDRHCMQQHCLEVQTSGKRGLHYRRIGRGSSVPEWQSLPSFMIRAVRDTAGSGDWCTAGLIHCLGQIGQSGFLGTSDIQVERSLMFGQAMAALSCCFVGARGAMYSTTQEEFRVAVRRILFGMDMAPVEAMFSPLRTPLTTAEVCSSCLAQ